MNIQEVKNKTRKIIKDYCGRSYNKCAVRINGRVQYLTELEIRALQIMVLDMTDEEYADFCNSVIIYNDNTVIRSDGVITILRDGGLSASFHEGFYDATGNLARALFMKQPILRS